MPRRTSLLLIILAMAVHLAAAGWMATWRPIDGDEGYYGLAARLVAEGRTPYADFFYPQAPLLPMVYAPAAATVGAPQLPGLRTVSVALGAIAVLLAVAAAVRTRNVGAWPLAAVAALLALSPELLLWHTTVKSYALANALTAGGLLLATVGLDDRPRAPWLVAGGVALGLAVSSRLLYAPAALAPAAWLLLAPGRRRPLAAACWLAGVAAGLAPVWVALARDPAVFWFNNVGYHQLRFSVLENAPLWRRAAEASRVVAVTVATSPGLLALTGLSAVGLVARRRTPAAALPDAVALPLLTALALTVTSLLPDPTYRQYFTGGLPVLLAVPAAWGLTALAGRRPRTAPIAALVAAPLLAWLALGVLRYDVPDEPHWSLDHYRGVCRGIEHLTGPDDTVMAFWPGYVAGADRRPLRGLENQFGIGVSDRLTDVQRGRYRIAGHREVWQALQLETARVTVVGAWMNDLNQALDNREAASLLAAVREHYTVADDRGDVLLMVRDREAGTPTR